MQPISLDGNIVMSYRADSDIEKFISHIKDNYNIDSFSDFPISVCVIDNGASSATVKKLYGRFEGAIGIEIVNVSGLLPFVCGAKEAFEKDIVRFVFVQENCYALSLDAQNIVKCEKTEGTNKENAVALRLDDFIPFFCPNAENFSLSKDNGTDEKSVELENAQKLVASYKETVSILEGKLEHYETIKNEAKRYVCKADKLTVSKEFLELVILELVKKKNMKDSGFTGEVESLVYYEFSPLKEEGSVVYYTEHIAKVTAFAGSARLSSGTNVEREYVSPCIGKIFYLKAKNDNVKNDEPIAVIGGLLDTREDAMNWYVTQYCQGKI